MVLGEHVLRCGHVEGTIMTSEIAKITICPSENKGTEMQKAFFTHIDGDRELVTWNGHLRKIE